jgi:pimeloyl-ACP methyl ester carboxylesterase
MGGDYAAEAAETEPAEIDRLVLLGSGAYTPLVKMKGRKLFILARDDANADGPRLPKIRAQYEKATEPKGFILLDGPRTPSFCSRPIRQSTSRHCARFSDSFPHRERVRFDHEEFYLRDCQAGPASSHWLSVNCYTCVPSACMTKSSP